jgi:hypothetical protein
MVPARDRGVVRIDGVLHAGQRWSTGLRRSWQGFDKLSPNGRARVGSE